MHYAAAESDSIVVGSKRSLVKDVACLVPKHEKNLSVLAVFLASFLSIFSCFNCYYIRTQNYSNLELQQSKIYFHYQV